MSDRKPVADAFRTFMGGSLTQGETDALDAFLDRFRPPVASPAAKHDLSDRAAFFAAVREITGPLDQVQVDTITRLLVSAAHHPLSWVAYELATGWHEARLKPIEEWGKGKGRPYSIPGKYKQSQHGRGLVQLTWDRNYEWADKALGLGGSLLKNFNRALEPEIAVAIMVKGMEEGAFTGKALKDYLTEDLGDIPAFVQSRRIINGTDRATDIAALAMRFQKALQAGGWA